MAGAFFTLAKPIPSPYLASLRAEAFEFTAERADEFMITVGFWFWEVDEVAGSGGVVVLF